MHKQIESFFGAGDGNKDGLLTFQEFVAGRAAMQRASPPLGPLGPRPLALWGALPGGCALACACGRMRFCALHSIFWPCFCDARRHCACCQREGEQ